MSGIYSAILEEFKNQLSSLRELIDTSQSKSLMASTRVASVRASTLLLAAIFEEFVREMALEHANYLVSKANSIEDLPEKMVEAAWKTTLEDIRRTRAEGSSKRISLALTARIARPRFDAVCLFVEGDISQEMNSSLVHNQNNMKPIEINRLFGICGISNVCMKICRERKLRDFFSENSKEKAHGLLETALNKFMSKRNSIAHSPNLMSSDAPDELIRDIDMLEAFANDLEATLISLQSDI